MAKFIQKQEFDPTFLGIFTNPFYIMRKGIRKNITTLSPHITGRTLDVGCGSKPYKDIFKDTHSYVGIEFDSPRAREKSQADFFYDGQHFPFPDTSFDTVIATEVFEHIFNPDNFLTEIHRTITPGGTLLITCPFTWAEHEQPYDYARYSSFGLRHIVEKNGFKVIEDKKVGDAILTIFQLIACYINNKLSIKNYKIKLLFQIVCISPVTLCGLLLSQLLPENKDLYLDNIIVAKKV